MTDNLGANLLDFIDLIYPQNFMLRYFFSPIITMAITMMSRDYAVPVYLLHVIRKPLVNDQTIPDIEQCNLFQYITQKTIM